jgi:hypothetical protein
MYAATTDNDGRFLLKDIKEGRYEFFATRPGFVDQHYQAKGGEKGATLSLKPPSVIGGRHSIKSRQGEKEQGREAAR